MDACTQRRNVACSWYIAGTLSSSRRLNDRFADRLVRNSVWRHVVKSELATAQAWDPTPGSSSGLGSIKYIQVEMHEIRISIEPRNYFDLAC